MQIEEYLLHYEQFHREFVPGMTPDEKFHKLCSEIEEHIDAVNEGIDACIIDETIDVMNTSIAYLHSRGIKDPLDAGFMKLQQTARKYRDMKNTINGVH